MSALEPYEVYAIRYARHDRLRNENFIGGDPHDGPMPLDFFVWVIRGGGRTFVLDTGFDAATARRRQRRILRDPGEILPMIDVDPRAVEDVIISHMHYDHAGNHTLFPNARYHLQDQEMAFSTGRCMCHPTMRFAFEEADVVAMVRRLFEGRVRFHDGADELARGLSVHHVGGHTMGLQVTRVWTQRGWVVLASDASHFYANMDQGRPFPVVYSVGDMLEGYDTIRRLASSPAHVIPGHDPLVVARYPAAKPGLEGVVARLDVEPNTG
jgi:glyoxylase-like metal-dependent hydrolase (beta-lactamase superfamily II)